MSGEGLLVSLAQGLVCLAVAAIVVASVFMMTVVQGRRVQVRNTHAVRVFVLFGLLAFGGASWWVIWELAGGWRGLLLWGAMVVFGVGVLGLFGFFRWSGRILDAFHVRRQRARPVA